MTANSNPSTTPSWAASPTRVITEARGVNELTYDITSKPPGTIEWE